MPGYEIARRTGAQPGFGQPHSAPRAAEPMARPQPSAADPALRASRARRSAASRHQGNDALLRGQPARRRTAARQEQASRLPGPARGRRRSLAHGLYTDAARSEGRNHHRLPALGRGVLRHATVSPSAPCSPTTAPATAPHSFATPARRCRSNTAAPGPIRPEPTARPSDLSRPRCASGPMQNTGPTPSNEMHASGPGPTTTTTNDPMVASTTSRPSAAPAMAQRLDHLQAPHRFGELQRQCGRISGSGCLEGDVRTDPQAQEQKRAEGGPPGGRLRSGFRPSTLR